MSSERYYPRLENLLRVCAANYFGLMKILQAADEDSSLVLRLNSPDGRNDGVWSVRRSEQTRYTEMLVLEQHNKPFNIRLQVRLLHDSSQAEVQAVGGVRNLRNYDNGEQHRSDERMEWNLLLTEWLSLCRDRAEMVPAEEAARILGEAVSKD
ncbi:MAG: DUF1249 domain-containing protein [Gammaproteobacteria bacterium AqS3]|nr:DUF1249 domain-containing protein [Gammaproteobacteria bacterium AqS3]